DRPWRVARAHGQRPSAVAGRRRTGAAPAPRPRRIATPPHVEVRRRRGGSRMSVRTVAGVAWLIVAVTASPRTASAQEHEVRAAGQYQVLHVPGSTFPAG